MKTQKEEDRRKCEDILLYEQQLPTNTGGTYETGHRHRDNHDGGDKLLKMEAFYLSFVLVCLFRKYGIFERQNLNLKFQVIYLGAASGVTESTDEHRILNHVEKLMTMFPKQLINFWWLVDPRPMKIPGKYRDCKHLQCLFSDAHMADFDLLQREDPTIRYIVISDIRTPINYDMTGAPREIGKDVLGAFFLCDSDEKRGGLFHLLQEVMEDAKAKARIVEEIIDKDQQYQVNVRNTLNLDAMSTKFRAPYYYPFYMQKEYKMLDIPRLLQAKAPENTTELREVYIRKDMPKILLMPVDARIRNFYRVLQDPGTYRMEEPESGTIEWKCSDVQTTGAQYQSVDLQVFDDKIAAYNHDKAKNEEKMQVYINSLYEICYKACTGREPTDEQLQCLHSPDHWRPPDNKPLFDQHTDKLFWAWMKDSSAEKGDFFGSASCEFMREFVQPGKKASLYQVVNEDSLLADMSLLVSRLLVHPDSDVMQELMTIYERGVNLRQVNRDNYSNLGCNPKSPVFMGKFDILMHIRILLLVKRDERMVRGWFEKYMVQGQARCGDYTRLVQRLLSVYARSNETLSITGNFSFMSESKKFNDIATEALERCKTGNVLQYMVGYIEPNCTYPQSQFLNTRHWGIMFYVCCVLKIAETKLDFEYPDTETNRMRNHETLNYLRQFFAPYIQQDDDGCKYFGTNRAWNPACWPSGNPILHVAASNGCTALVYLILNEFLPPGSKFVNFQRKGRGNGSRKGGTALHLAVYEKHSDIEQLLMAHGANPNIICNEGNDGPETIADVKRKQAQGQSGRTPSPEPGRGGGGRGRETPQPGRQPRNQPAEDGWQTVGGGGGRGDARGRNNGKSDGDRSRETTPALRGR